MRAKLTIYPTTYTECGKALSSAGKTRLSDSLKIGNNTWLEGFEYLCEDDRYDSTVAYAVRLHRTRIVTWLHDDTITISSGGYRSTTTRERLRSLGVQLYSYKGDWYVAKDHHACPLGKSQRAFIQDDCVPFKDGMTISGLLPL